MVLPINAKWIKRLLFSKVRREYLSMRSEFFFNSSCCTWVFYFFHSISQQDRYVSTKFFFYQTRSFISSKINYNCWPNQIKVKTECYGHWKYVMIVQIVRVTETSKKRMRAHLHSAFPLLLDTVTLKMKCVTCQKVKKKTWTQMLSIQSNKFRYHIMTSLCYINKKYLSD